MRYYYYLFILFTDMVAIWFWWNHMVRTISQQIWHGGILAQASEGYSTIGLGWLRLTISERIPWNQLLESLFPNMQVNFVKLMIFFFFYKNENF